MINHIAKSKLAEAKTITLNGKEYRDLNKNGKLDIYENLKAPIDQRVENHLKQMMVEEKAGMMFQPMIGIGENGELATKPGFMNFSSSIDQVVNDNLRHFNVFMTPGIKDFATELRWARINCTFGEDAALSSMMTNAYIYGFQGPGLVQPATGSPVFSRQEKQFRKPFLMSISAPKGGASIEYKTEGGHNKTTGWKLYDKPLNIDDDCIIYARALRYGYKMSEKVSLKLKKDE